ncbi:MAG TPA: FAD-dependent tricarballylate dehydrogenase TcuA [Gaiellaceae bacterium]|nr:FAD-dependent tricarballylate dehydrogenase TcuA [Gaiellaceae bacterium]
MSDHDVVVVGGGNAGLVAALAARDEGARVLLIERSPRWRRGGNSRHTRDIRYAHDEPSRWAPAPYPEAKFLADLAGVSDLEHADLAELMVAESRSLPTWMEEHGVRWQPAIKGTLDLATNLFFLGGGKAMINAYYAAAERSGVEVRYDARVSALAFSNGRCAGVTVESAGRTEAAEARAVVVAAGGFEANHSWLAERWGRGAANFIVRGTPDNDGAVVGQLFAHGARPTGSDLFHSVAVDARAPRFDGGIVTRVDSIPFSVVLNKHGHRFEDEGDDSWPKRYAVWGQRIATQPDQLAFSIFDRRSWGLFIPPFHPPFMSTTLDGLIRQLDLDADAATHTIHEFNASVDGSRRFDKSRLDGRRAVGIDPPRSNWAQTIEHPPFFAYPLRPGITFTYAAVAVDASARVLREDGSRFENVFAAGEAMAGNILDRGYLAGVGLTIGSVFGRIAGREAARA